MGSINQIQQSNCVTRRS